MPRFNTRIRKLIIGTAVVMGLWLASGLQPARAIVQPRVYDWQKRLSKVIPAGVQETVADKAAELSGGADPELIKQAAAEIPCDFSRPALELFLGIKVLLLQDRAQQTQEKRLQQTQQAIEVCEDYIYRLDKHKAGTKPGQIIPSRDNLEQLPEALSTPEWQLRLRLPSFDEYTTPQQLKSSRDGIDALRQKLEAEEKILQAGLERSRSQNRELRRYVLQLCDSMDPLTCRPYVGQRPTVLVIPPPPLDPAPLQ